jgi:hypothetical protein
MPVKDVSEARSSALGFSARYHLHSILGFLCFVFFATMRSQQVEVVDKSWIIPTCGSFLAVYLAAYLGWYIANQYNKNKK